MPRAKPSNELYDKMQTPLTDQLKRLFDYQVAVTIFLDKESDTLAQLMAFYGRSSMNELIQEMLYRGMFELKSFMEQAMKKDAETEEGDE